MNVKSRYGQAISRLFWNVARATSEDGYLAAIAAIRRLNDEAAERILCRMGFLGSEI